MRRFLQEHGRNERAQVWEIFCNNNAVYSEWGQLGGAMQKTVQKFEGVNIGKANVKSPGQVAQEFMDRLIKKKEREGYHEVDTQTNKPLVAVSSSEIDFDKPLPINLRFFKPQNTAGAGLLKKTNEGKTMALRKRNGMMHVIVSDSQKRLTMYGSIMLPGHKNEPGIPWLERYPMIHKDLEQLAARMPPRTILLGELVTVSTAGWVDDEGYDVDDFEYVESIVKSKKDLAWNKQNEHGHLGYCIWDIAFWGGGCLLQTMDARSRHQMAEELAKRSNNEWIYPYLRYPESSHGLNEAQLVTRAKKKKWEGFVLIDPECAYEDKAYNFHGKPERPKEVGKLKPTLEIDVIAYWDPDNDMGAYGKGKKSVGVGSAAVYLWDPVKQEEVYICDVGGGLTDAQVKEFANPRRYPKVWQVEFANWTPKGAMFHPVFLHERDDKTPEECTVDQRPALTEEAEEE